MNDDETPDFRLCIACGTIIHEWEDCEGFCTACQKETLGDQNVPMSRIAKQLDLRNRKDAFHAMQMIKTIKALGIVRTSQILTKLGEMI